MLPKSEVEVISVISELPSPFVVFLNQYHWGEFRLEDWITHDRMITLSLLT